MNRMRVLYSFPHRIGAARICSTAWEQVKGVSAAGADVLVFPASIHRALPPAVRHAPTLARGDLRVPFRLLGQLRAITLHDHIVARRLRRLVGAIDIIHTWPLGALETLGEARRLGIPTVLERPNAHTRFAYEAVRAECERIGVELPPDHEHAYNEEVLQKEEAEYELADRLLCPSDFVVRTFLDQGMPPEKLVRHIYGVDEETFYPAPTAAGSRTGLRVVFVGVAAVRKGLHFALDAWLSSPASDEGSFLIAGDVLPSYQRFLARQLAHPSVRVLGHCDDVPELMRGSDILVLPSIEEGFGLVCTEAMASGCVPLVSDACTDVCRHLENALVHRAGDVRTLVQQITTLQHDRTLLARLRENGLQTVPCVTWKAAGWRLLEVYREVVRTLTTAPSFETVDPDVAAYDALGTRRSG
jgi:glycosyltransferase involved in cell wall biosynthesis